MAKVTVCTDWLDVCSRCHMSLLDIDERIVDLLDPAGEVLGYYDKVHLVPFGETVPPWADLVATDALVREVGRFTAGDAATPLPARVPLGVAICYEVVFSSHSAAAVRSGAEVLVTLTNDWFVVAQNRTFTYRTSRYNNQSQQSR